MLRFMVSHILVVDPTVYLSKRPTMEGVKPSLVVANRLRWRGEA